MSEYIYTTADLAAEFRCAKKTIRKKAAALSIGIDRGGPAGYLYSESDRQKLIESMKPVADVPKKDPRGRRAA